MKLLSLHALAAVLLSIAAPSCGGGTLGRISDRLPSMERGACAGLDALALEGSVPLMHGRVHLRVPEGLVIQGGRTYARFELRRGDAWLEVEVEELNRRAPAELAAGVQRHVTSAATITRVEGADGQPIVLALYDDIHHHRSTVALVDAFARTDDGMVVRVGIGAPPIVAEHRGCQRLATTIARGITRGERAFSEVETPGEHWLTPELAVSLPPDHTVSVLSSDSDITELEIAPITELGAPSSFLRVLLNRPRQLAPLSVPFWSVRAPALGELRQWREWRTGGRLWRDTLVETRSAGSVLIAMAAGGGEDSRRLEAIAASLTERARRPAPLACGRAPTPPRVEPLAGAPSDDLSTLLSAESLALTDRIYGMGRPATLRAFRRVIDAPDATRQLRHLAEHGTTAGRLYALAGLFLRDPSALEGVLCAVRDALDDEVVVLGECGPETRPVAPLLESPAPDAIRGERFWPASFWMREGTADLLGGALVHQLVPGRPFPEPSLLAGDGFVPPLDPGAPLPAPLESGDPSTPRATALSRFGGLCWTREDGRVACAGSAGPASRNVSEGDRSATGPLPNVVLLPDMVRHPTRLAVGLGVCVLDANGRRACVGGIEHDLAQRAERCGQPAPRQMSYRVFDDGPWRELVMLDEMCGIRASDGALYCFRDTDWRPWPRWMRDEAEPGRFGAYRIPIEGRVRAVAPGSLLNALAITEDGVLWEWDDELAPRPTHRFDRPVAQLASFESVDMIRLEDGRLYLRGARAPHDPYSRGDRWARDWVLASLDVREVQVDHHACFRFGDGRVGCWGSCGPVVGQEACGRRPEQETLSFVEPLRGAARLFVGGALTCASWEDRGLRCVGQGLRAIFGADGTPTFDLDALGRAAREPTLE